MFLLLFCCIAGALAAACRSDGNLVATCVNEKCEVVGQTEICTECKAEEAPRNGVCADLSSDTAVCAEKAGGKCTKCAGASFMYKGGCYQTTQQPEQTMCADASDGKCTRAADGGGFFVPDAGTSETKDSVVSCGDSAGVQLDVNTYKGVQNCETCNAPSAGAGPEKVGDLLHPPVASSAVLLGPSPAGRPKISRVNSLNMAGGEGGSRTRAPVSQRVDMHGSSEAVTLAARTPAQVTLPPRRSSAAPEERTGRSDRPAPASPPDPAPVLSRGREPAEDPGPHSRLPGPIPPSPAWPDGARAPRGDHPAGATTGFDRLSQRPHPNQQKLR